MPLPAADVEEATTVLGLRFVMWKWPRQFPAVATLCVLCNARVAVDVVLMWKWRETFPVRDALLAASGDVVLVWKWPETVVPVRNFLLPARSRFRDWVTRSRMSSRATSRSSSLRRLTPTLSATVRFFFFLFFYFS
jgi:hypothetical protein